MLPERTTLTNYRRVDCNSSYIRKALFPIPVEHQERYIFAARIGHNTASSIIDAGSGCGWGSDYLSRTTGADLVVGVDFDPGAITEAEANFRGANLRFCRADLSTGERLDTIGPAPLVVSFETLEHFPEEVAPSFLSNLRRLTLPDGMLVISSPNGPLFSPYQQSEGKPWLRYHFKEYTPDEIICLLNSSGWEVNGLYGQRFVNRHVYSAVAKLLYPLRPASHKAGLSWDHRLSRFPFSILQRFAAILSDATVKPVYSHKGEPIYIVAVCTPKIGTN